jgi:hypothetical protein
VDPLLKSLVQQELFSIGNSTTHNVRQLVDAPAFILSGMTLKLNADFSGVPALIRDKWVTFKMIILILRIGTNTGSRSHFAAFILTLAAGLCAFHTVIKLMFFTFSSAGRTNIST